MKTKQFKNSVLFLIAFIYLVFAQFAPFVHSHDHVYHAHADASNLHSHDLCHIEHETQDDAHNHGCCQVSAAHSVALQSAKIEKSLFQQNYFGILASDKRIPESRPTANIIFILEPAGQEFYNTCGSRSPPLIS